MSIYHLGYNFNIKQSFYMKTLKYALSISIIIFFSSCNNKEIIINEQLIKQEVSDMFDAYTNYVNTKGLKGVDFYFSKDERFYWVEDGLMQYPNRESLLENIDAFYPSVTSVNLEVFKKDITILTNDKVSLYVEYKEDIVLNSGYIVKLDGAMTILTIRENNSWKFLIGHSSIKKQRGDN